MAPWAGVPRTTALRHPQRAGRVAQSRVRQTRGVGLCLLSDFWQVAAPFWHWFAPLWGEAWMSSVCSLEPQIF